MSYDQFAAASQFYLYGRKNCTRNGYLAAKANQHHDILTGDINLDGKVFIVTGGSSGVGFEILSYIATRHATVFVLCRDIAKCLNACKQFKIVPQLSSNNDNVHIISCDCSLGQDVARAWARIVDIYTVGGREMRLDGVLCNAGALIHDFTVTEEGIESTLATHLLFGTFYLVSIAMKVLLSTSFSRVVVVSSGGMYYTKFPEWEVATSKKYTKTNRSYDGQTVYAYSKRGQVVLCEQWASMHPSVTFISCHPGWVDTPGLRAAYGDKASLFAPLRSAYEGAEGIIFLLVAPSCELQSGEFYLDRKPRVKHMAGPFFSEGTFTKNTDLEVSGMMQGLLHTCKQIVGGGDWEQYYTHQSFKHNDSLSEQLSACLDAGMRITVGVEGVDSTASSCGGQSVCYDDLSDGECKRVQTSAAELLSWAVNSQSDPLEAMRLHIDMEQFMGRWYVHAHIPTIIDKGTVNNVEEYEWDEASRRVRVLFRYSLLTSAGELGQDREVRQIGAIENVYRTQWTMAFKFLVFWPLDMKYLILAVDGFYAPTDKLPMFAYQSCMIGVPDRRYLWIMTRSSEPIDEDLYRNYLQVASSMGYDDVASRINRVPIYVRDAYGNVLQADVDSAKKDRKRTSVRIMEGGHDI